MDNNLLEKAPLGKKCGYVSNYDETLLFPIPRDMQRKKLGILDGNFSFSGFDLLNAYEMSWLNGKGKPVVAIGRFVIPSSSPCLIESKSFKLYLNSFNDTEFDDIAAVKEVLKKDLNAAAGAEVSVEVFELEDYPVDIHSGLPGESIDNLDVEIDTYNLNSDFLKASGDYCEETLNSNLLKSNCLITGQPDWGSIVVEYKGTQIDREGLLKYIVSFRRHNDFHEHCVEKIFCDIMQKCSPEALTVYAKYTRRGGLDINPLRTTEKNLTPAYIRLIRQ
ncbi:NADPH-dependent 7-cyano-7-deazaguanine reductase QueF [Lentisphaerota bacterium ZTH]|nr:NADPH-dependent 7-cyano-7-deazaguanine reductase QueF [Lentisphaerota bacterium]WET06508.1 NADPH-dependent 7-cyano-7-deazaguanine reductase QueF [Lentisphaerota bacterium ZTH]